MRTFFLPLLVAAAPLSAHALEVPKFKSGGFLINLQWGVGKQHVDGQNLAMHGTSEALFANELPDDFNPATAALRLAYNILGYASVGVDLTATGWDITNSRIGGGGFLVGLVAVHPLQFVFMNKEERPFGLDVSTHFGAGYGIIGVSEPFAMAMDGPVLQWGFAVDYFFTRHFGLQFFSKCTFLLMDKLYVNWDGAHSNPPVSGTWSNIQNRTPAGTWWHTGIGLVLRIGE